MEILFSTIFLCLFLLLIMQIGQNRTLRKRLSLVESSFIAKVEAITLAHETLKAETVLLTKDQEEWLKKNKDEVQKKINKLSEDLKKENQQLNADQDKWVADNRAEFDKRLAKELEAAVDLINFKGIEYKQTITKKRQEYSRKNAHKAKPQREIRYIDEDDTPSMQF